RGECSPDALALHGALPALVVVGGAGRMGRLFARMLGLSGYDVRTLDRDDWPRAAETVRDAGMVLVSVPIHDTEQVIAELPPLPRSEEHTSELQSREHPDCR